MEVDAVVEAGLRQVDEVGGRAGDAEDAGDAGDAAAAMAASTNKSTTEDHRGIAAWEHGEAGPVTCNPPWQPRRHPLFVRAAGRGTGDCRTTAYNVLCRRGCALCMTSPLDFTNVGSAS